MITFDTHPDRYKHWKLTFDGPVATLSMDVREDAGLSPDYTLKLNSYDLGVDIELADAIQRLRFEHPEVRTVIVTSLKERIFCAGANIMMLRGSSHVAKVNFCKFTNETRLAIEDASEHSGLKFLAALNGICAGGGYELALACDDILLVDDGNSAVSLPEAPLLGVLPGTGGLTRVVDKRHVRRDLADVFCTLEEGVRAPRALEWGLVDAIARPSEFAALVEREIAAALAHPTAERPQRGVELDPLAPSVGERELVYRHLRVSLDAERRTASLALRVPRVSGRAPDEALGAALRLFRELDDALLRLRLHHPELGLWLLRVHGDAEDARALDRALAGDSWLARELRALFGRVCKRLENSARSVFALLDAGSCWVGSLAELALAADRAYARRGGEAEPLLELGPLNHGAYPMANGLSRLSTRFTGAGESLARIAESQGPLAPDRALELGLVTEVLEEIDWDDSVRLACEERASFSPDALTGLEANLRFPGPETLETKIFARLSAWQNWIFQRPNAAGPDGALRAYGRPERPKYDWKRT